MVDPTIQTDNIETRKDLGTGDEALYAYWMGQEKIAEKEERKWVKQAREIIKRYRDERPESIQSTHRYNILWSNVQTLIPTLYARTPKPDVSRRFTDPDQDTARFASMLLERTLEHQTDSFDFDDVMKAVVEDRLLPGRGVARVLYIPHFGEKIASGENSEFEEEGDAPSVVDSPSDEGSANDEGSELSETQENTADVREVVYEEVVCKYVFWEDYREGPARKWSEVPWVRYRAYMDRDELVQRFGKDKGNKVNLDFSPKGLAESVKNEPPPDIFKKAVVHEYWDKVKKQVVWLSPGTPDLILDEQDDPLGLPDFFPNPDPLLATTTNDKRVPVPDYIEYQDQARELDRLTARIDKLTIALKVSGVYPGEEKQVLQQLIDEGTENRLIPVGDWQAWAERGGLKEFIQWLPIQQVAQTLIELYQARDKVKQDLFEITGIGDIMRGATSPVETLGAQKLKTNFVTRRVMPQQKDVAKFARNLLRLMGYVIGEHFSPKTISMITGYPQLLPAPQVPGPQPPQFLSSIVPPQQPGMPPQQGQQPNPAFAQWQEAQKQFQAVTAENQKRQQQFDAAVALIKQDIATGFKIDIEADSTIAPDEEAEKASRTEFLSEFVPLMQQLVPLAQGNPALAALTREVAMFGVRAFRAARSLEETIEKAFDALAQMPPPPPKNGAGGQDSPEDLATRRMEAQTGAQVKLQTAAMSAGVQREKLAVEAQKAEEEAIQGRAKLALEAQEQASQQHLRQVREPSIEAKTARVLV